jgi:hypothetical protein
MSVSNDSKMCLTRTTSAMGYGPKSVVTEVRRARDSGFSSLTLLSRGSFRNAVKCSWMLVLWGPRHRMGPQ